MKIALYTDIHISTSSSIMPMICEGSKYTTRLDMILRTGKWMYELFDKEKVDLIVNLGDTMDSHTVKSDELSTLSDFYSLSKGTREIVIPGNHEIFDNNRNFYSVTPLKNVDFIQVVDNPSEIDGLSFLPYMKAEEVTNDLLRGISGKHRILFSHIDIKGSHMRPEFIMDSGVDPELLTNNFDLVLNGHLHTAEMLKTSTGVIWNVGATTSGSFNDSNEYIPSVCILDTNTMKLERFNNPNAILFRRIVASNIEDLINKLNQYGDGFKYIFRVTVPYDIREEAKSVVARKKETVTYRVISDMSRHSGNGKAVSKIELSIKTDLKSEFTKFIESLQTLSYPIEKYREIISKVED